MRQLRQEEEALLHSTIAAMDKVWQELLDCRARQGHARTDVAFSVVQLPNEDTTPNQQVTPGNELVGCLSSCWVMLNVQP